MFCLLRNGTRALGTKSFTLTLMYMISMLPLSTLPFFVGLARQADMESDIALARHVTFVHQFKKNPELDFEPFDPSFLKLYISQVHGVHSWGAPLLLVSPCL